MVVPIPILELTDTRVNDGVSDTVTVTRPTSEVELVTPRFVPKLIVVTLEAPPTFVKLSSTEIPRAEDASVTGPHTGSPPGDTNKT